MAHHAACDHDHDHTGVAGTALAAELAAAEARCVAADQRLTAPRRRVLEQLLQAGQPVKAYDLIATFGGEGPPAKPPTVYRALDFLEKQGFAHRIESLNAYVACTSGTDDHAAAFLICDCCGATQRGRRPPSPAIIGRAAQAAGYAITGDHDRGARPLCAACSSWDFIRPLRWAGRPRSGQEGQVFGSHGLAPSGPSALLPRRGKVRSA